MDKITIKQQKDTATKLDVDIKKGSQKAQKKQKQKSNER